MEKVSTSIRLTPEAKRLLEAMAAKLGSPASAVMEAAIREKARREKVE